MYSLQQIVYVLLESRTLFSSVAETTQLGAKLDGVEQRLAAADSDVAKIAAVCLVQLP